MSKTLLLSGVVGDENFNLLKVISFVESLDENEDIEIMISSGGGDVFEGLAIYDYLKSLNRNITTIAIGNVSSAASIVFLSTDERYMTESATLMLHRSSIEKISGNYKSLESTVELLKTIDNVMLKCFEKSGIDITNEIFINAFENEIFLTSEKAKELNLTKTIIINMGILNSIFKNFSVKAEAKTTFVESNGIEYAIVHAGEKPAVGDMLLLDGDAVSELTITIDSETLKGFVISTDTNGFITEVIEPVIEVEIEAEVKEDEKEIVAETDKDEMYKAMEEKLEEKLEIITAKLNAKLIASEAKTAKVIAEKDNEIKALKTKLENVQSNLKVNASKLQTNVTNKATKVESKTNFVENESFNKFKNSIEAALTKIK